MLRFRLEESLFFAFERRKQYERTTHDTSATNTTATMIMTIMTVKFIELDDMAEGLVTISVGTPPLALELVDDERVGSSLLSTLALVGLAVLLVLLVLASCWISVASEAVELKLASIAHET